MKNLSEQILKFKKLSGIINEQEQTGFCVKGDCKNGEGEYLGPLGSYKGSFKNDLFNDLSGDATLDTNVNQNDFALENFDLTKNFHTHIFKYTGQFVNGEFDGEGIIEFSDGVIYEGDFNENKIEGIGTFTFKDGSIYQGKVETEDVDGSKSKYILDYGNGTIDDVINYNSKNSVEILKLEDSEKVTDDDSDSDVYDYTDLNIYFSETKGNPGIVKYVDKNKYPQIKDKKVKITLEYIGDKTIKKEGKIDTGYFKFGKVRIGRYNLTADGKGLNEFKTIVDIDEDTKELTILLKNSNMKEDFLVNKIKKMLFESVDDIKVGDYYRLNDYREKYIKITELGTNDSYPFKGIEYIIWEELSTFQFYDDSLIGKEQIGKLDKIDKSKFIETAKNFLKRGNVKIEFRSKESSLDDLIKVLPEFKEISSQPNINNNNNTKDKNVDQEIKKVNTPDELTKTYNQPTTQKPIENKKEPKVEPKVVPNENINIEICENLISEFYQDFLNVWRGQPLPKDLGDLESNKRKIESCVTRFGYKIKKKRSKKHKMSFENVINTLKNIPPGTDNTIQFEKYFEITPDELNIPESKDIYSNSLSNSIMKVLKEHSASKKVITTENNIIKNRLDFIYKTSNNYDLNFNLLKESKELIKKGYNENVVKTYYKRLIN
jgi:hypothetical protein